MEIIGVILAGGLSSRFGSCKSKLCLHKQSILENTHALLSSHCNEVYISCREEQKIHGYPCIYDNSLDFHKESTSRAFYAPIMGIYSALKRFKAPVLVLSCDMPFMDSATIAKLITERNAVISRQKNLLMTTFRKGGTPYIEALVAIYEVEAMPFLQNCIEQEKLSLSKCIAEENRHHIITYAEKPFFNINYPQDLIQAEALLTDLAQ